MRTFIRKQTEPKDRECTLLGVMHDVCLSCSVLFHSVIAGCGVHSVFDFIQLRTACKSGNIAGCYVTGVVQSCAA